VNQDQLLRADRVLPYLRNEAFDLACRWACGETGGDLAMLLDRVAAGDGAVTLDRLGDDRAGADLALARTEMETRFGGSWEDELAELADSNPRFSDTELLKRVAVQLARLGEGDGRGKARTPHTRDKPCAPRVLPPSLRTALATRRSRSFGEAITAKRFAHEIWYLPAVQRLGYPKTTHAELLLP